MADIAWNNDPENYLDVAGSKLEYACYGPPPSEAPTIVMLHEGLGCVALWRGFPERLAKATGYGVFVYSRAGYGKSSDAMLPRPIDYMADEAMDVLPKVLDAIDFRKGVLLGHSDGATIAAIHFAFTNRYELRGIIMMAPHFFAEKSGIEAIAKIKQVYENGDLKDKLSKYHTNVDTAFYGWSEAWLNPDFHGWNVADAIDHWRLPVLAIQGRDDEYGTLAQIEEIENRIYSPAEIAIYDNCGHSPHFDKPEETLNAIVDFLETLDRIEAEEVSTSRSMQAT
ncbi:MAG: alpha/beta hydrolase [Pseudomonadota bacterium]